MYPVEADTSGYRYALRFLSSPPLVSAFIKNIKPTIRPAMANAINAHMSTFFQSTSEKNPIFDYVSVC